MIMSQFTEYGCSRLPAQIYSIVRTPFDNNLSKSKKSLEILMMIKISMHLETTATWLLFLNSKRPQRTVLQEKKKILV